MQSLPLTNGATAPAHGTADSSGREAVIKEPHMEKYRLAAAQLDESLSRIREQRDHLLALGEAEQAAPLTRILNIVRLELELSPVGGPKVTRH